MTKRLPYDDQPHATADGLFGGCEWMANMASNREMKLRWKVAFLRLRLARLDRKIAMQRCELDRLNRRIAELEWLVNLQSRTGGMEGWADDFSTPWEAAPAAICGAPDSRRVAPAACWVAPSACWVAPAACRVAPAACWVAPAACRVAPAARWVAPAARCGFPKSRRVALAASFRTTIPRPGNRVAGRGPSLSIPGGLK